MYNRIKVYHLKLIVGINGFCAVNNEKTDISSAIVEMDENMNKLY